MKMIAIICGLTVILNTAIVKNIPVKRKTALTKKPMNLIFASIIPAQIPIAMQEQKKEYGVIFTPANTPTV